MHNFISDHVEVDDDEDEDVIELEPDIEDTSLAIQQERRSTMDHVRDRIAGQMWEDWQTRYNRR